jgi:hypothetical protein
MTKLLTIAIIIAITAISADAELTPKQFDQLRNWAMSRGYTYDVGATRIGTHCFVFSDHLTGVFGLVPVSSDTADEAINALIASVATFRKTTELAQQSIRESYSNGYREGVADGMERHNNERPS